jgi:hypothetical protein
LDSSPQESKARIVKTYEEGLAEGKSLGIKFGLVLGVLGSVFIMAVLSPLLAALYGGLMALLRVLFWGAVLLIIGAVIFKGRQLRGRYGNPRDRYRYRRRPWL